MAAMIGVTVWGQFVARPGSALPWLDVAIGVLSLALMPVLLRWPIAGALVLTALATLSPAATAPATVAALLVAQRRRFPVALAVAAAGVAAHVVQGLWRPSGGISFGWWLALIVISYGALVGWGTLGQARRALLDSLRERARRAEAEQGRRVAEARMMERTRIAREMHDVLAHRLSLLATYAGALEYRPDAPPEQLAKAAGVVRDGAHLALDELRQVIIVLREDDEEGESSRPQPVLADLPRLVEESRDAGGEVELTDTTVDAATLPAATARTVYRVVQEGLTNARKHAAGRQVCVALEGSPGDRLVIDIRNRLPADPGAAPSIPGSGTGLVGLTERVRLAGGSLDHQVTGGEFRLHAWLPWPA
ncbi:sensor histidine kinase [Actinomadura barringtoniae]|uniref:histidine kinase n=2 Tax=Actinomadura barringtoniae TaxID=1427535 RepID=A0A939PQ40_9ACTN|nr:sensor histidine kinase [Actinomadura barringtoniae]